MFEEKYNTIREQGVHWPAPWLTAIGEYLWVGTIWVWTGMKEGVSQGAKGIAGRGSSKNKDPECVWDQEAWG